MAKKAGKKKTGSPDITDRKLAKEDMHNPAQFPDQNPNPVLRIAQNHTLLYANRPGQDMLAAMDTEAGRSLPDGIRTLVTDAFNQEEVITAEIRDSLNRTFFITVIPPHGEDYVNIYGSDITRGKLAEEALKSSEERYRTIADFTFDWEYWVDPDGRFIYISPSAERILGRPVSKYTSAEKLFSDVVHPEDLNARLAHMAQERAGQGPFDMEFRIVRPDGEVRWIHHVCRPVLDSKGKFLGTRGSNRDITKRKQAEEALQIVHGGLESGILERTAALSNVVEALKTERHRLYDVLETLPVYVCLLTPDYRMPFANRYFRETFGESHGRPCYDFLFNRTEPCEICETYTVMKTRAPHHWYWTGPNGRDYDIYDFPFTDSDGSSLILEMGIDITERRKAEEALRRASVYNRTLLEASLDPLVAINPDGTISDVNAATIRVTGYSREDLIGTDFSKYFTEPEKARAGYEKVFRDGSVTDYELGIRHRDGHVTPVMYNATVYRDETGNVSGVFAAARDVTERRKAEEEQLRLAAIVEHSDDAIIGKSLDGIILSWNAGAERIYGYSAPEAIGRHISLLIPPSQIDDMEYIFGKIRDGEQVLHYETVRRNMGGMDLQVSLTVSPIKDIKGNLIGISTISRDVTERKKTEEAVRRAYAYNRSLIEASLDPLVTISPDGKISDVNAATVRVTGYSREELIGTDFSKYFTEPEKARAGYEKVFRDGSVTDYELGIRHKDGHITPVLYNATVYRDESGNVTGVFAAARDSTERKRAEEVLRQFNVELEKGIKEKTTELANINVVLHDEIAQRKLAEINLRKTLSLLNATLESTADGIFVVDRAGRSAGHNRNFATMWNIPESILKSSEVGAAITYVLNQLRDPDGFSARIKDIYAHPERESYDMLELNDGRIFERYSKPQKIGKAVVGRVWSFRDITERRRAEEDLVVSLHEKEVLLREIHHRVKNNLQLISGLLDMTRMRTQDESTGSILTDMMMKIQTMAQIHTRLYESKQFDRINMEGQVRDQVAAMTNIYSVRDRQVGCEISADEIYLPVDQAIPCSLVINEILSNTFKHAFKGREHGDIGIFMVQDNGRIRITIRDNGVGMPAGFDAIKANTLGVKLMRTLVQHQLKGSLMITSQNGTEVVVEFPIRIAET